MKYIERQIEEKIKSLLSTYKVVLVTGARQVGKTRLLNEVFFDYNYISFDDYSEEMMAKSDAKRFLTDNGIPLIIDEVQRVPEIFRSIKLFADKKNQYGQYVLSGSQLFKLMNEASDSLAGRVAIVELPTLSLREIMRLDFNDRFLPTKEYISNRNGKKAKDTNIWEIIIRGMYPELQNAEKDTKDFYDNYIRTYLERDVREIINVQNLDLFYKFMVSVATRTGQLINYSSIASDVEVDADTIKKWISVLETSNIIYILYPYAKKELKRVIKTPKLYFRDTGLACYLTRWLTVDTLKHGAMNGAMFETFVISEIIKSYSNNGLDYKKYMSFYYGRDNKQETQAEIDLLIEENNVIYPIEIKMTMTPSANDIKNFSILDKIKSKKIGEGAVICQADKAGFINNDVNIIPYTYI
ncbi:MAG: ATP-binding protein [Lachnospiraceae bacterium]|nr:ATP-binding protein [Lachnospiraceae bacterium]